VTTVFSEAAAEGYVNCAGHKYHVLVTIMFTKFQTSM
jgi:hypothetical protein